MRNVLLSGAAAIGLLSAAPSYAGESPAPAAVSVQKKSTVIVKQAGPDRTSDFREPEYSPEMRPNAQVYNWSDDAVFAAPDGSSYKYDGEWDGKYVDPQGRVFEGDWSGRVTRQTGATAGFPAPPPHARMPQGEPDYGDDGESYEEEYYEEDAYAVPLGYENYERCLKSNGVKGAAIGALLGGALGNRIAGRGNRTGGTLVGAGIGGLLGVAVEKANDKCKQHRPRYPRHPGYHGQQYYGWGGGYYYYPQAPVVTITMQPTVTTTTTVTEEIYYETVRAKPRKKVVRKWKPKPRCVCR